MLIGYVSDERYVAIPDVLIEFQSGSLPEPIVVHSTPRGEIYAPIPAGNYDVVVTKPGYGSKMATLDLGAGTPHQFRLLSDGLLGYMYPLWAKSGCQSEFRVHAVEEYRLSLWRYGLTKSLVRLIGWLDEHGPRANMQITPDGDYTQTGVQWNRWGHWNAEHAQFLTAPEKSGLYYLHAKTISGKFFSFPWIVAPSQPSAQVAVLASVITWNAYNNFGGRSNYINPAGLPAVPIVNGRLELSRYRDMSYWGENALRDSEYKPISFDRPDPVAHIPESTQVHDPVEGRRTGGNVPGEWRMLAWMEREGFVYDLYADVQLHLGELPLDNYKVLVLGIHPEYWSRDMYQKVKAWVYERGGKLVYLGGNGLDCEVEFQSDGTVRYLTHAFGDSPETVGDVDRPGMLFESRMHRTFESGANLLGVVYTNSGVMTAAPYRVLDESHWAFAETGLKNGSLLGATGLHERVPGGASGHETDKRSPFSPPGTQLLAKGTNRDDGGAEMVHYKTPSGGEVFSVGSISFVASLLVDSAVSRVTSNVLRRFMG
jgi:N,N-dimethylformamidase